MDEHFHFRADLFPDLPDFRKGQFPGQHHPAGTQLFPGPGGGPVGHIGLGAHMEIQTGRHFPGGVPHPQVGHQQGVHPGCIQVPEILRQRRQIAVVGEDVHGHIDLFPHFMGKSRHFPDLLQGKIGGKSPEPESLPAQVHGISSVQKGHPALFQAPGGSQQFRFVHCASPMTSPGFSFWIMATCSS